MPTVNLPRGIKGLKEQPKQQEYLVNYLWTETGLLRTPGIESFSTGFGVCRGGVHWKVLDKTFMVSGTRFISIDITGAVTDIGEIPGTEECFFSEGQVFLVIGRVGDKAYTYSSSTGLAEIVDPDFQVSVSADFIDGRHVFVPADGSPVFYSDVDLAGSIDPLSFFDAEELPDVNKAVINISNQLYVLGTDSTEVFRTNVDPDVVFTRREGARVDVGYLAGLTRYVGSFAFLGRERGESYQFFVMGSGTAQVISNAVIDEILEEYTEAELKLCRGDRYKLKNNDVLVFTLPRHTLCFSNGNWFYKSSGTSLEPWRAHTIISSYGKYIVGDNSNSSIGKLSDVSQEYGQDVFAEIKTFIRSERGSFFKVKLIELEQLSGVASTEETVGISITKDGYSYPAGFNYKSLGKTGEYRKRVKWQPVGHFEDFCGIKVKTSSAAKTSLELITFE